MALLGSLLLDIIAALAILVYVVYLCGTSTFNYFKKRGIPYVKPLPFVGNFGGILTGRYTANNAVRPLYEELKKHPLAGVFQGQTPLLMVNDPELIKLVLTKDFAGLRDRGNPIDEKNDPMSANLFNLTGDRWKNLRMKLSPVFTSGKLKQMFPLMKDVSETLSAVLRKKAEKGEIVEMRDLLTRYGTDVIGTCAFGVECNSLKDPESLFYKSSQNISQPSLLLSLRFSLFANSELFSKLVPLKFLFPDIQSFFIHLMKDTINYRKTNNVDRNDFVKLLMQLQDADEGKTEKTHPDEIIFNDLIIAAQAFLFFIAGLDAISSTVGFALHHLSLDPRLQEDVADEVLSVMSHHNGEITYESVKEMKLVDMVMSECMRVYSPVGMLQREVTAPSYTFPGAKVTLKKGAKVVIPVDGLHYDPEYFPDPEKFDPYRFTEEENSKRHPYVYLPFGEGPRVCIATRFARLEMSLCLASLIKDFKFSVCSKTQIQMKFLPHSFATAPSEGFNFKIEKRSV